MTASVGDVLNHGDSTFTSPIFPRKAFWFRAIIFWMPKAGTPLGTVSYENMANTFGVELGGWSFGAQFGDLNNDGFLDLYVTNGNVSLVPTAVIGTTTRKSLGEIRRSFPTPQIGHPLRAAPLQAINTSMCGLTTATGAFKEVAQHVGVKDVYDGRSVALADFGNRGVLDVVVANQSGPLLLYKTWLRQAGIGSNLIWKGRKAIGVRSARRSACSGMDNSNCKRCRAAAGFALKTKGASTSGWESKHRRSS